ncbi:MAG: bifunctional diaminohydroxyphosphoribosylaminopyrimidine deaminase/5-amino-6-(5-phosphoribosylamino)uracil reductase RibD [gamma proteobacterium symbiont of Bathyaustriella thionipta]|nr:bifunctional diaminohydroxyphosphoribosylaminopyrimidine deaminase/5-amino-6-(5-phosphoribosylamino)uracil reductase RibD [gamma proteobacterium symbiont of Bathyaustriella thionipta]
MARALRLARLGLYTTHPNPRVGCVIVKNGEIVGQGWHYQAGQAHAERIALQQAGDKAKGSSVYVTLEPCSHYGRTPPCADALIEAGVARVVAAMTDPNPLVSGAGLQKLQAAGIQVESGLLQTQAEALNPGFVKRMRSGLPWVRCKMAMSLDGRTAMANGESKWITGEAARQDVHKLRARSDAIMTGIGTVLADDPGLNVRLPKAALPGVLSEEDIPAPKAVVLDSRLRMPPAARLLSLSGETLVLTCLQDSPAMSGAEVITVAQKDRRIDLQAALQLLASKDINEVMLECGATLAGSMLQQGLVDELIVYMAPHLMGDAARGLLSMPAIKNMRDRIALQFQDVRQVGDDLRLTLTPQIN